MGWLMKAPPMSPQGSFKEEGDESKVEAACGTDAEDARRRPCSEMGTDSGNGSGTIASIGMAARRKAARLSKAGQGAWCCCCC